MKPTDPPNTPPIAEPANSIENAFATFVAALRFYEACLNRRIDCSWFGNHWIRMYTGDGIDPDEQPAITVRPEQYTYEKLSTQALNLLYAAMGSMAAAVYEAAATDSRLRDPNVRKRTATPRRPSRSSFRFATVLHTDRTHRIGM